MARNRNWFPDPVAGERPDERLRASAGGLGIRADLCFFLLFVVFAALGVRLYRIQCRGAEALVRLGNAESTFRVRLPTLRGYIYDTRMRCMAMSVPAEAICASIPEITDPAAAARKLAPLLGLAEDELVGRLLPGGRRKWIYLRRRVDSDLAEAVRRLRIPGIITERESRRCYPLGRTACHILGLVSYESDGVRGIGGIELAGDRILRGADGWRIVRRDSRGRTFREEGLPGRTPVPGRGLVLTVDACIQEAAREELARAVEAYRPKSATCVVLDPHSGAILALVNWPDYDPAERGHLEAEALRVRAITEAFEPGSVFKPFVAAAAREAELIEWDEEFDCEAGAWRIGRRVVRDHKPFGKLTCAEGLIKSSNIWAAKVGERLGPERMYGALRCFGFGQQTGVGFPGESPGLLRPVEKWTSYSPVSISFGQEIMATPVQLAAGYAALVNGGLLIRPRLVRAVTDAEGRVTELVQPQIVGRVLSSRVSAEMRQVLAEVVRRGTGRRANIREYALGGKTGTAQKAADGRYVPGKYVATFAGFGPVENPRLVAIVTVDEPQGAQYGGEVAAPVVAAVLRRALVQLGVPTRSGRLATASPAGYGR